MKELARRVYHEWSFVGERSHGRTFEKARRHSLLDELFVMFVMSSEARPDHKLRLATGNIFIADKSSSNVAMRPLTIRRLSILQAAKPSSSESQSNLKASLPSGPERNNDTIKRR